MSEHRGSPSLEEAHAASRVHPVRRSEALTFRLIRWLLLLWLLVIAYSVFAAVFAPAGSPFQIAAAIAFTTMFVGHFGVILASVAIQSRARRLLERAEAENDVALARRALRLGMPARSMMRGWLLVARDSVDAGRWDDADQAIANAYESRGWMNDREAVVHLALQRAFVKAVRGELAEAEKQLGIFGTVDESIPQRLADFVRAKAVLLYKREAFREVVDFLEAMRPKVTHAPRDQAMLAAIEQSSLLRLQAGAHRIAAPAEEESAWLEPILTARRT